MDFMIQAKEKDKAVLNVLRGALRFTHMSFLINGEKKLFDSKIVLRVNRELVFLREYST